jgi:crotonobetainyl-CoA:carnitine CoA-transferase CaiB-like acyl-CoA transferase
MQPFAGIRVVDLTRILAGPYGTYQLALLGAEVIKIEIPGDGDWTRVTGVDPDLVEARMGTHYLTQNAGKKSVTLNMRDPRGIEILRKLIATADVFVENFRPGAAGRLGLAYDDVRAIRPDVVYCSLSAYGQTGPWSHRKGYDHVLQGVSGIMSVTGSPETGPMKTGAAFIDYATGLNAAFAITAAVLERNRTGESQRVDVAMLDTTLLLMANMITDYKTCGYVTPPMGNEPQSRSPSAGLFQAKDGPLLIAANGENQYETLMRLLGLEALLDDPRYRERPTRIANKESLRAAINAKLAARTAAEWETILEDAEVPAGQVRSFPQVFAEGGQAEARGVFATMDLPGRNRTIGVPSVGFWANGAAVAPANPPPELGAHTDAVLAGLGYDPDAIAALRGDGVI